MNILHAVIAALEAIIGSPLLAQAPEKIGQLLTLVVMLAKEGDRAADELATLAAEVRALDEAGGIVSEEVWDRWEQRHEAAHARLQALKGT